jgi:transposase InsO family protein
VGSVNSPTTGHSIFFKIAPVKEVRNMISHLRRFDISTVAKERFKMIKFYCTFGERATKEAFGVDRKIIYIWRKRLAGSRGNLASLRPYSTAPKRVRCIQVNPKVLIFLKTLREDYPNLGKRKIKPILDAYSRKEGLPLYSEAKVGRLIKFYKLFYQKTGRLYHNPASKWAKRTRTKRLRVRYSPKPTDFGYIQMDTVVRFVDGVRYYLYDAVDTKGKFALSLPYKHLNSPNTVDFMKKLLFVSPFLIKSVQTDNGLEFLGEFETYLKKLGITHLFTYPRCPKINGVVERFNRTIQEDFIDQNLHLIHDPQEFSLKLANYLLFFNSQRVHEALNYMTPLDYLIQKGGMSKKYWSRTCR